MLHVILLDCAMELVPREISALKVVQKHAQRRGKKPNEILLDQNYHGSAMTKLDDHVRRGRPDITFLSLMSMLESPLCKAGHLMMYLHLQDGRVIQVNPEVRLPRNYERFVGLFEQLLVHGRVPPKGKTLLHVTDESLSSLVDRISKGHDNVVSLLAVEDGVPTTLKGLSDLFHEDIDAPVIVGIGAFPHGDMSDATKKQFTTHLKLDREVMMAWHVCAEIVWTYTARVAIIEKRYGRVENV